MHAVLINVSFDDPEVAQGTLGELVPRVAGTPGFVAGYWIALAGNRGTSTILFDSEAAAQGLVTMVHAAPTGGVRVDSVEVGEVIAQA